MLLSYLSIIMVLLMIMPLAACAGNPSGIQGDTQDSVQSSSATEGTDTDGTDTEGTGTEGTGTQGTDTEGTETEGTGTEGDPEDDVYYNVTFLDVNGEELKKVSVKAGELIDTDEIPFPSKSGYTFKGWFTDEALETRFVAEDPITEDVICYPWFSDLSDLRVGSSDVLSGGIVPADHKIVVNSESEITAQNLSSFVTLTALFGDVPTMSVSSLGDNQYQLSAEYPGGGHYQFELVKDDLTFDGMHEDVRKYDIEIAAVLRDEVEDNDDIVEISSEDILEFTQKGEETATLKLYAKDLAVDTVLSLTTTDGEEACYVIASIDREIEEYLESGKKYYELTVTVAGIEHLYNDVYIYQTVDQGDMDAEYADEDEIVAVLENSESMLIFADYLAMAINDTPEFQELVKAGKASPLTFNSSSLTTLAAQSSDREIQLLAGTPGLNLGSAVEIKVESAKIKKNQQNEWWKETWKGTKEYNPHTGEWVDTDYNSLSKGFTCAELIVSMTYIPAETHGVEIKATATFRQWFKICTSYKVLAQIDFGVKRSIKKSDLDIRSTTYIQTQVALDVTVKTQASGTQSETSINITQVIEDMLKKGEDPTPYDSSNNKYIEMFRRLYNGKDGKDIEIFKWNIAKFSIDLKVMTVEIPVDFVVKMDAAAGVGIEYNYYNSFNIGVVKDPNSTNLRSYATSNKDAQDMTVYAAGHIGMKAGVRATLKVAFTKIKLLEIELSAEFGVYADLYGYYYMNYTRDWHGNTKRDSGGAYYFDFGLYAEIKLKATAFWVISGDWKLYEWEKQLFELGDRYVLMDFLDSDGTVAKADEEKESYTFDYRKMKMETLKIPGFSAREYYTIDLLSLIDASWFDLVTVKNVSSSKVKDAKADLMENISISCKHGPANTGAVSYSPLSLNYDPATGKLVIYFGTLDYSMASARESGLDYIDFEVTVRYDGPSFSFNNKPQKVIYITIGTDEFIDNKIDPFQEMEINYYIEDELYESHKVRYGTPLDLTKDVQFRAQSDLEMREEKDLFAISFPYDYEQRAVVTDLDIHADILYDSNMQVYYKMPYLTGNGIEWGEFIHQEKGSLTGIELYERPYLTPSDYAEDIEKWGVPFDEQYFIGWNLVGTSQDELNDPVMTDDEKLVYEAVYSPEVYDQTYTVTITHYGVNGEVEGVDEYTLKFGEMQAINNHTVFSYDYTPVPTIVEGEMIDNRVPLSDVSVECRHEENLPVVYYVSGIDDKVLYSESVRMGEMPTAPSAIPSVASYYLEDGSLASLSSASYNAYEPVDWYAVYIKLEYVISPKITLLNDNGEVYQTHTYPVGVDLNAGYFLGPDKPADEQYSYSFSHWENVEGAELGSIVTETATYKPVYDKTEIAYYVVFQGMYGVSIADGTPLRIDERPLYSELDGLLENWFSDKTIVRATDWSAEYTYTGYTYSLSGGVCLIKLEFEETPIIHGGNGSGGSSGTTPTDPDDPNYTPGGSSASDYFLATLDLKDQGSLKKGDVYWSNDYGHGIKLDENGKYVMEYTVIPGDTNKNFVGWMYEGTVYKPGDEMTLTPNGEGTFEAVYENKEFKLEFYIDGELADTLYADNNEAIYLPTITPKQQDTSKYYIRSTGWMDSEGEIVNLRYTVTGDMIFTAEFEEVARLYNVTFVAGEKGRFAFSVPGSDDTAQWSSSFYYDEIPNPLAAVLGNEYDGYRYEFVGWSDTEDGEAIRVPTVTDDATYYAVYERIETYTVTFDAGDGALDLDGTKTLEYVFDEGYVITDDDLPYAFRKGDGGFYRLAYWKDAEGSEITADVTFNAVYQEAVTTTGIYISDGKNTEDIAAFLSSSNKVAGYTYDVTDGYDHLVISADGLTLSGRGSELCVEILDGVSIRMNNLFLSWSDYSRGAITAYGNIEITIEGVVTLSAVEPRGEVLRGESYYDPETGEFFSPSHLIIKGVEGNNLFVINSKQYGVSLYDYNTGMLELVDLNADITIIPTEDNFGIAMMSAYDMKITDSTVNIHSGTIYASSLILDGSDVNFLGADGEINLSGYDENGRFDAPVLALTDSTISFQNGVAVSMSYFNYETDEHVIFNCYEDAMGTLERYESFEQFIAALDTAGHADKISVDEDSEIN